MELRLAEIGEILKTAPSAEAHRRASGYSIDSRTVRPGELFFAVRGARLDGHDFVLPALAAGAVAAVVAATRLADFPAAVQPKLIAVPEALTALQELAAAVRQRWGGPLVAVTGSAGKTTTKQMLATLLGTRFRVLANEGNLNNQFGLPLSLLRLTPETEVGVFELAMSGPGEIRRLAALAAPDVGVVTNVGPVHLEFFPDVEAIAGAKYELIESLGERAWAVLNADDPRVRSFGERLGCRVLYFGVSAAAHFRAVGLEQNGSGGFRFALPSSPFRSLPPGCAWKGSRVLPDQPGVEPGATQFHLPLLGRHNVQNLLAALAGCYALGILPAALQEAVERLQPPSLRGEQVRLANGALVVNDCYNSNPEALEAMLGAVAALPGRRHIAVLGGMLELGPSAESLHRQGL